MPIYEYKCTKCQFIFDDIKPVGTNVVQCPRCEYTAEKSSGSYLTVSPGLPNGHSACRT